MNPNKNYGLWMIMMYQCRFIDFNNIPLWCKILIVGKAMHVSGGKGINGNSLYFLLNFV